MSSCLPSGRISNTYYVLVLKMVKKCEYTFAISKINSAWVGLKLDVPDKDLFDMHHGYNCLVFIHICHRDPCPDNIMTSPYHWKTHYRQEPCNELGKLELVWCLPGTTCGFNFNSLWSSDEIWSHRTWSTLVQVMACCLMASSHYLNQCWHICSVAFTKK